ncbi:MAG TPA: hypothetical protein VN688_06685 [Gemmataceae bacterium]|nr:hypothetical protein [Gemmataceae bacterium]
MNQQNKLLCFAVLLLAGCGGPSLQTPAEPTLARDTLRSVLDAWQRGDALDSLRSASPAVQVNDPDWLAGCRLTDYQFISDGTRAGIDIRFPVLLTLKQPNGRTIRKNTAYMVGTSPVLTVVRHDPQS